MMRLISDKYTVKIVCCEDVLLYNIPYNIAKNKYMMMFEKAELMNDILLLSIVYLKNSRGFFIKPPVF